MERRAAPTLTARPPPAVVRARSKVQCERLRAAPARRTGDHAKGCRAAAAVLPRPDDGKDVNEDQTDCAASDAPRDILGGSYAAPAGAEVLPCNARPGVLRPQKSEKVPEWAEPEAPRTPCEAPLKATGKAAEVDWYDRKDEYVPKGVVNPGYDESWENLASLEHPIKSLEQAMAAMEAANKAGRAQLDWEAQQSALVILRRVVKHHPEVRGDRGKR
jgi:hypothetical protein